MTAQRMSGSIAVPVQKQEPLTMILQVYINRHQNIYQLERAKPINFNNVREFGETLCHNKRTPYQNSLTKNRKNFKYHIAADVKSLNARIILCYLLHYLSCVLHSFQKPRFINDCQEKSVIQTSVICESVNFR